jgi:drug/metabolite transporter (DMT)-like permease
MPAGTLFWVLLAMTIGGLTPSFTKLALEGLGPWTLVAGRQSLGLGILVALSFASGFRRGVREPFSARDWALLLAMAWAGFALPMALLAFGIERSTATQGALLAPVEPIGILVGGALLLGERLTLAGATSIALGAAGTTLVVLGGSAVPGAGDPLGDSLIAAGYVAWAIYTLAAKPLVERHHSTRVSLWAIALSIPPLALLATTEDLDPARALPAAGWLVVLAFTSTALGTYSWNRALRTIRAGTMAAFVFVQPLVGLAVGVAVLGEPVGALALAGTALVVAGVTLAGLRGEVPPDAAPGETPGVAVLPESERAAEETSR